MLGRLQEYLYLWQLPFIGAFLLGWILGGGYLLRGSVRKALPEMRRHISLGRCVLVSILSGATALGSAIAVYVLVNGLGAKIEADLTVAAVIVGIPVAGVMAVLSVYATFHLTLAQSVRVLAPTAGAVLAVGAVLAGISGGLAYKIHQREVRERWALDNLLQVSEAIRGYEEVNFSLPPDLKTLTLEKPGSGKYLLGKHLRSHSIPDRDVGFFYLPLTWTPGDFKTLKILICELPPVLPANRRAVMFTSGKCILAGEAELQSLLERPENAEFATALQAAAGP